MSAIFNPPLSTQRYCWVQDFINQDPSIKSVTDVGCSYGRMIIWLKHISNLELINCIDKDLPTIEDGIESNFNPNLYEMLFGRMNSEKRLDIRVYHGDIAVPDERLQADCFTMVELIEHMPLDHLERVCQTVFGYYRPRFVIVTTPNIEFNPLLQSYSAAQRAKREQERLSKQGQQNTAAALEHQNLSVDGQASPAQDQHFSQPVSHVPSPTSTHANCASLSSASQNRFRHHDHKFEWNRAEFSEWANLICKTFAYDVTLGGVGELPGSEPLGPCTQIALFKRNDNATVENTTQAFDDPTLCFDLFLNKLSVQEPEPEFLGDQTLRRICLRTKFHIPGTPAPNNNRSDCNVNWGSLDQSGPAFSDWNTSQPMQLEADSWKD